MHSLLFRREGVKLALTITPFVSTSSSNFLAGVEDGIFISEPSRNPPINAMYQFGNDVKTPASTTVPALTTYKVFADNIPIATLGYR